MRYKLFNNLPAKDSLNTSKAALNIMPPTRFI